jgi:hypothetical protein
MRGWFSPERLPFVGNHRSFRFPRESGGPVQAAERPSPTLGPRFRGDDGWR